jgi:hypothetical protein
MKPSNYIFTYRSHLNYRTFWQRHYCETPEDIVRLREEIDEELNEEENEN